MWHDLTRKDCKTSVHGSVALTAQLAPLLSVAAHAGTCARTRKPSRGIALAS